MRTRPTIAEMAYGGNKLFLKLIVTIIIGCECEMHTMAFQKSQIVEWTHIIAFQERDELSEACYISPPDKSIYLAAVSNKRSGNAVRVNICVSDGRGNMQYEHLIQLEDSAASASIYTMKDIVVSAEGEIVVVVENNGINGFVLLRGHNSGRWIQRRINSGLKDAKIAAVHSDKVILLGISREDQPMIVAIDQNYNIAFDKIINTLKVSKISSILCQSDTAYAAFHIEQYGDRFGAPNRTLLVSCSTKDGEARVIDVLEGGGAVITRGQGDQIAVAYLQVLRNDDDNALLKVRRYNIDGTIASNCKLDQLEDMLWIDNASASVTDRNHVSIAWPNGKGVRLIEVRKDCLLDMDCHLAVPANHARDNTDIDVYRVLALEKIDGVYIIVTKEVQYSTALGDEGQECYRIWNYKP